MRKIIIKGSIVFLLLFICIACHEPKGHEFITIVNCSTRSIVCQEYLGRYSNPTIDSLFQCDIGGAVRIWKDSLIQIRSFNSYWEVDLLTEPYMQQFIIMDDSTYSQYWHEPCDTIRKYVPILQRYQLTLADLERMNWVVVYPPEE